MVAQTHGSCHLCLFMETKKSPLFSPGLIIFISGLIVVVLFSPSLGFRSFGLEDRHQRGRRRKAYLTEQMAHRRTTKTGIFNSETQIESLPPS